MKKGLTELVFILDKSGSMGGLETDTIEAWHLLAKNNTEEALAIANGIRDLIERVPGVKPGDIAILCRKNDTCKEIATCLEALGVRASVGQGLLMDTRECMLATAALRYMNNQADTISVLIALART